MSRRELILGAAFIALLTLVFFFPLLEGKTLSNIPSIQQLWAPWRGALKPVFVYPQGDQALFVFPNIFLQTEAWRSGIVPLWNPFNFLGTPVLAHPALGVLYPVRALLSVTVSPLLNHDLFLVLHVFGTGLFMFLFLKELRLRLAAALLGATGWMFASWSITWMQTECFLPTTCWLPAALLLVHRGATRGSWRTSLAAGVPLGIMAIGGNVQTAAVSFMICGVWATLIVIAPAAQRLLRERRLGWSDFRPLAHPLLVLGVGAGLAAVTLLPTALVSLDEGGRQAVPYPEFVSAHTMAVEEFRHVLSGGPPTFTTIIVSGVFVGVIPFFLAIVGFFRRRPGAALGRWLAVATFLVAIGAPAITRIAYIFVPGLSRLNSTGYILWVFDLGIVILAALGLDAVLEWATLLRRRVRAKRYDLELGRIVVAVVSVVALTVTAVQLIDYARYVNPPFTDRDAKQLFYPQTPALSAVARDQRLRSTAEPQRTMNLCNSADPLSPGARCTMLGEPNLVFSTEDVGGYDIAPTDRVRTLTRAIQGQPVSAALTGGSFGSFLTIFVPTSIRYYMLPRVGVTTLMIGPEDAGLLADPADTAPLQLETIYQGDDAAVFDVAGEQPRAWVTHTAEVACSGAAALRRFVARDFDYRDRMIVEPDQGIGRCGSSTRRGSGPSVAASRDPVAYNGSGFTVDSPEPGWLVMADAYAPGWSASVNGEDTELLRADYALRAVEIPAGRSRVVLQYRTPGLVAGGAISAVTFVGASVVGVLWFVAWRRRRRTTRRRASGV